MDLSEWATTHSELSLNAMPLRASDPDWVE
jgi:hypothetical protein